MRTCAPVNATMFFTCCASVYCLLCAYLRACECNEVFLLDAHLFTVYCVRTCAPVNATRCRVLRLGQNLLSGSLPSNLKTLSDLMYDHTMLSKCTRDVLCLCASATVCGFICKLCRDLRMHMCMHACTHVCMSLLCVCLDDVAVDITPVCVFACANITPVCMFG